MSDTTAGDEREALARAMYNFAEIDGTSWGDLANYRKVTYRYTAEGLLAAGWRRDGGVAAELATVRADRDRLAAVIQRVHDLCELNRQFVRDLGLTSPAVVGAEDVLAALAASPAAGHETGRPDVSAQEPDASHPHGFVGHEANLCQICSPLAGNIEVRPTPSKTRQDRLLRASGWARSAAEKDGSGGLMEVRGDLLAELFDAVAHGTPLPITTTAIRLARSILGEPGDGR